VETTSNRSLRPDVGMQADQASALRPGDRIVYRRSSRAGTVVRVDPSGCVLADGSGVSVCCDLDATAARAVDRLWLYPYEIGMPEATE
jgi:hypothetical protein